MDIKRIERVQILTPDHSQSILDFERQRLAKDTSLEPMEQEMASWHAKWRLEQLEHYLSLGWSAGLYSEEQQLQAYYLAQPLVFFRGLTQSLWVEHFAYVETPDMSALLDMCYRQCREKHLQTILFHDPPADLSHINPELKFQLMDEKIYFLKTAKF